MWRETLGLKFSPGLVRRLREIAIQRDGAALSFFSCFGFKQRNYRLFVAYKSSFVSELVTWLLNQRRLKMLIITEKHDLDSLLQVQKALGTLSRWRGNSYRSRHSRANSPSC